MAHAFRMRGRGQSNAPTYRTRVFALVVAIGVALAPSIAAAKSIGTMTIAGITASPVPILAVDWSATNVTGRGAATFAVIKSPDAASPALFFAVLTGTRSPTAQIVATGSGGGVPTTFDLEGILVQSVDVTTDEKGKQTEAVRLLFTRFTITAGGVSKCWDFQESTDC